MTELSTIITPEHNQISHIMIAKVISMLHRQDKIQIKNYQINTDYHDIEILTLQISPNTILTLRLETQ